jgi:hypothetical protein
MTDPRSPRPEVPQRLDDGNAEWPHSTDRGGGVPARAGCQWKRPSAGSRAGTPSTRTTPNPRAEPTPGGANSIPPGGSAQQRSIDHERHVRVVALEDVGERPPPRVEPVDAHATFLEPAGGDPGADHERASGSRS